MSLLASLFRSAWTRIARGQGIRQDSSSIPQRTKETDRLGAFSTDQILSIGIERLQSGDLVGAENHLVVATERAPERAEAQFYLGVVLLKQKRYEDAIDCFVLALHRRPDFIEARFQLGLAQFRLEQFDGAIESFATVVNANPDYVDARCNLGFLLYKHREELDEAEAHLRRALELEPEKLEAKTNLAMVLDHRGQTGAALEMYDRILEKTPEDNEVRLNRSLILLARGDYARGWSEYEARRDLQLRRDFPFPDWDGSALDDRVILVHAEQGLGDEIMFASCLGEVIRQARHCVIECHPKLEKLFRRSYPAATVHGALQTDSDLSWAHSGPRIDCKVGIGSLPLHFRQSRADFPNHTGYLRVDPARREYWRARLGALGDGPKIGVSWRGGAKTTRRHMRSIPLAQWVPLLRPSGRHFISLQYGDCQDEISAAREASGILVHHWPDAIEDYDETAALVTALDLVISVQTAVIHLGGALGRPVWGLVSHRPEWRYQEAGQSLPWYPSVRLIRQSTPGDWTSVLDEARRRLEQWPA